MQRRNLRWYPIIADSHGSFRGDGWEALNARTLDRLHEHALLGGNNGNAKA